MTDSTGASGFLPTVTFTSADATFTSTERGEQLTALGITGLYEANFADNITTIDDNAFLNDIKVVVVTINKVVTIGSNAFNGCTVLRAITLDTAIDATTKKYVLTTIGLSAFSGCTSLRHLHIPDTVKQIPGGMCFGCANLELAVMGYGCASRDANDNYIADGTIGDYAFANCSKLAFFIIPETVASVGQYAFQNDPLLSYVAILGKPTFGTGVFGGTTLNTSAARYVYDITMTDKTFVPSSATKNEYNEYEFTASSGTTITSANVVTRFNSFSPTPAWVKVKFKGGTGTGNVQTIGNSAFTPANITDARYSKIIGFSLHSSITTIEYGAFEAYNGTTTSGTVCNMAAHYIPNSVTTTTPNTSSYATFTFNLAHQNNVQPSQTKQIVFQSGPNKIQLGQYAFRWNSARAIILYDVASTYPASDTIKGIPLHCFTGCFDLKFCNFFQKNAYSTFTRINGQAFNATFTNSGPHYIHIPKQIQASGFADVFLNTTTNIVFTVYDKYLDGTAGNGIEGLGTNTAGTASYIQTTGFGIAAANATFHIICNWYDANGLLSGTFKAFGYNYHLLFPSSIRTITNRFAGNANLKSIAVHHSATQTVVINDVAFHTCTGLNFVYFNNRVKTMGFNAFRNAPLNNSFDLIDAHPLETIYHGTFYSEPGQISNLKQITVPNSVKYLGSYVFGNSAGGQKTAFTTLSFETGITFWGDNDNATFTDTNTASARYMAIPAYFCVWCDNLTSVSFLNTVDANGNAIPADRSALTSPPNNSLPIPTRYNSQILTNKIKRIGRYAFQSNLRLQSIRIPDGVTTIDEYAFYDNYSLNYLYLPDSLTSIGSGAFNYMNYTNPFGYTGRDTSIRIPQSRIDDANNTYFNTNNVAKYYFTVQFDNTSGKVTNGVLGRFTNQAVNAYIFYHVITLNGITGILGNSSANTRAFDGFTSLKTVTIADTVRNIGPGALEGCTGLTNVFISPTSNVTIIDVNAFKTCPVLTSFFIPNSLRYIYEAAFAHCTSLATVTYGDNPGLEVLGPYAFYNATKTLTSIFIPSSVIFIGLEAFVTNDNTTDINILNTITFGAGSRLKSIDIRCFGYNGSGIQKSAQYLRDLVLPNGLRFLGNGSSPIQNTHRLAHSANLVVPSSLEVIPWAFLYADSGVTDISNIYFPRSITNVAGPRVHSGYSLRGSLLGAEGYSNKAGSLIYLPSELSTYAGYDSTYSLFVVTAAGHSTVARTRSYYKTMSFTTNPLTSLTLSSINPITNAAGAAVTNAITTTQIHANIQEGVTVIGSGSSIASAGGGNALNLISVNIPSTVTDICANAFNGCGALAYVTFSENSKLTTISNSAFLGCSMIHDIQLPDTLTTIGANAFNGCYNLASISIPYNVTSIGAGAFNVNSNTSTTDIVRQGGYHADQLGGDIYGEAISDYSGYSVSISSDGKILAIGAIYNDGGGNDAGHVRVYKYQTIPVTDTTWANYTVGSFFQNGTSPFNKPIVINGGDALPIANKYYWVQLGMDINGDGGYAGWSVSLSSDGTTVAIGALVNGDAGTDAGQVRVYKYQTIAAADWTNYNAVNFNYVNKPIVASGGDSVPVSGKFYWVQLGADINGVANSQSGNSVALNSNGTIVVIGARYADIGVTDGGSVRIYQYNGSTTWNQLGTTISGGVTISDMIGYSVAISDDGTTIAYGAPKYDTNGGDRGLVNIFKWNGTTWSQLGGTHIQGELAGDNCGDSVSLSSDGTIVAIGAFANDGGGAESTGHVRVFKFNGTSWNKLGQDIDGLAIYDHLGNSVSLSSDGTILAVGSRYSDTGSIADTGLVRIYKYFNGTWQKLGQDIRGYHVSEIAGHSVSLSKDGTTVAIGANGNDINNYDSGAVRVYQISNFTVRLHQRLYDTIHASFSTYFPGISPGSVQVIPALTLTNTLNPSKLTISQINNMYIRYRQSQLGGCTRITVNATGVGGSLTPADVTNALAGSTGLVHLDIGTNVTSIAGYACENNTRIYSVAISKTVTTILINAFVNCTNLTYLSFHPDSVFTSIGQGAFLGTNIIDIALPDSLTAISAWSFQNSFSLTSVCIPRNVTDLSANAFYNCTKLTSVALPASLTAYGTATYFNTNGSSAPSTFTYYSATSAIPHFKLSDYSMPSGIIQTVIDSAVKYIDHRAYAYYPDITLYAVTTNKQTQTPGEYSYITNNVQFPIMPSAFWLNGGASNNFVSNSLFPIYRSIPDLNLYSGSGTTADWPDDADDYYILMPEYSICIYNNLYDEENLFTQSPTYRYYDNEFGTVPLNITINVANTTSSILIMCNGRILSKYFAS